MIKLISGKVACFLCTDEDNKDNYELYEYAIYIVLSSAFHIATIIFLGLCFHLLAESLVFYFSFIAIRKFAGGYHAKTPIRCYVFSIITTIFTLGLIFIILIYNSLFIECILLFLGLISLVVICLLSPIDTGNNSLNNREKILYRKISIISSVIIFVFSCLLISLSFTNFGISLLFGIFMSALVLILGTVLKNRR